MTNKCRHNTHLHEQASRNEYQYNAVTRINIRIKKLAMEIKTVEIRNLFFHKTKASRNMALYKIYVKYVN